VVSGRYFRAVLEVEVEPGTEEAFERAWLAVARRIAGHPGNLGQWLMRGDDAYYIFTDWTDEDTFRRFETSEEHRRNRELLAPYRTGGKMITMRPVYELTTGEA